MQTNNGVIKFQKKARFKYDEVSERVNNSKKLNKVSRNNKRGLWENENN